MNNLKKYAGLLNDAAPKGEFLAYINEEEAEMLKDNGALGLLTPQGIPSFFTAGQRAGDSISPGTSSSGGNRNTGYGRSAAEDRRQDMNIYGGEYAQEQQAIRNQKLAQEKAIKAKEKRQADIRAKERQRQQIEARERQQRQAQAAYTARIEKERKAKEQYDARLDYITGKYLDVTLDDKQKKEFEQYRTGVRESINPSQKLSNKVVGGLLNTILPGSGMLYNFYLDSTAMGYKMQNPFGNLFGGGEISLQDVNNLRGGDNGSDSNARSQLVQSITQAINPNLPTSQVNNYFKNIGSKGLGVSPAYMNTYNQAKDQMAKSLNLTPNNQQFGYTANPYPNYSMSMTSANPFFDPLTEQGLI